MKKLITFFFAIVLVACQDTREQGVPVKSVFKNTTGQIIPYVDAVRWITNYQSANYSTRSQTSSGSLTAVQIASLTTSTNLAGLIFHHALDDGGLYHILVIPANQESIGWNSSSIVDATTGANVLPSDAVRWAASYISANPGKIQYHFFGSHVFDEIASVPGFSSLDIEPATNDSGAPQLLLVIDSPVESASGRVEYDKIVYDFSSPCPPYCSSK